MPLSEFSLIYRYFSALGRGDAVDLSVGDDCAILSVSSEERLATSIDTMVEGVHFYADAFPEDIGFRAVTVAASDLAAMGARPLGMTLALTLPDADDLFLQAFSQGVAQAVEQYDLPLVGGDTTRGPLTISVQVMGALPREQALLRSGAQVGDAVYVSGTLGDAAGALAFMEGAWQPDPDDAQFLYDRLHRPQAKIALGRQLLGAASAAIDISDGLLADAEHIATASGVEIALESALIPLSGALRRGPSREQALQWALTGGDDYELCYCIPEGVKPPEGTRIGRVISGTGVSCDVDGGFRAGFDHFDKQP